MIKEGIEIGEERGIEHGIEGMVKLCKEFDTSIETPCRGS